MIILTYYTKNINKRRSCIILVQLLFKNLNEKKNLKNQNLPKSCVLLHTILDPAPCTLLRYTRALQYIIMSTRVCVEGCLRRAEREQ